MVRGCCLSQPVLWGLSRGLWAAAGEATELSMGAAVAPALVGTGRPPRPSLPERAGRQLVAWERSFMIVRAGMPVFARPWGAAPAGGAVEWIWGGAGTASVTPASPALAGLGRCWYS